MQDSEKLINIDKEIKKIKLELDDFAIQLGGVFLDQNLKIEDCILIDEIEALERSIPEIKGDMIRLQGYTQDISESEDQIVKCNEQIKSYESAINSLYEKIGIELYSQINESDFEVPEIDKCCQLLKGYEKKSGELESKLYKQENSVAKKKFLDIALQPFKLGSIKKEIKKNNKDILDEFRELGKFFTTSSKLVEAEERLSLIDLLNEYKSVYKLINAQIEKRALLNSGIEEKSRKIKEDSKGVKLKTVYSNLESEIVKNQKMITEKLKEFGHYLFVELKSEHEDIKVQDKLTIYSRSKETLEERQAESNYYNAKIKSTLLKREIKDREENILLEENHIKELKKTLTQNKKELKGITEQLEEIDSWIDVNGASFEE